MNHYVWVGFFNEFRSLFAVIDINVFAALELNSAGAEKEGISLWL